MNQIPNIEETNNREVEEMLEKLTWYQITEGVDEIERGVRYVNLEELRTTIHQQLQKAREDMLHTLDSSIDNVTYAPQKPSDYKAWQDGFMEAYQQARKIIKHFKLDKPSV